MILGSVGNSFDSHAMLKALLVRVNKPSINLSMHAGAGSAMKIDRNGSNHNKQI